MEQLTKRERDSLLVELDELVEQNANATHWGAALSARHERIAAIRRRLEEIEG
jgi:hypothetical protein